MATKSLLLALVVVLYLGLFLGFCLSIDIHDEDLVTEETMWDLYERWQSYHSVSRQHEEKHRRFNFFKDNVRHIHRVNKMNKPYKLKLNEYADMANPEFKELYGFRYREMRMSKPRPTTDFMHAKTSDLPDSVDWRSLGAVTSVKNQGSCGSCWAFATVATIEGINQIKTKQLVSLSEQELVDCDSTDEGCNGGLIEHAYDFVKRNGGLTTETFYPYLAKKQSCNINNKEKSHSVIIDGYESVPENDEEALKKAVGNQPVAVGIDASGSDLQFYSEGVFTGDCGKELNHAVTVVGYGNNPDGTKYWIVKNSWGTRWGEGGYIKMERGLSGAQGKCGIAMDASYPVKHSNVTTTAKKLPRRMIF